jgi:hypothetical protein
LHSNVFRFLYTNESKFMLLNLSYWVVETNNNNNKKTHYNWQGVCTLIIEVYSHHKPVK